MDHLYKISIQKLFSKFIFIKKWPINQFEMNNTCLYISSWSAVIFSILQHIAVIRLFVKSQCMSFVCAMGVLDIIEKVGHNNLLKMAMGIISSYSVGRLDILLQANDMNIFFLRFWRFLMLIVG